MFDVCVCVCVCERERLCLCVRVCLGVQCADVRVRIEYVGANFETVD